MNEYIRLGVNIDHVATIRNARGSVHPDPVKAAKIAQSSGADGITAHLREDRRHISDGDIKLLKEEIDIPLNLEMAPTQEMLDIALEARPERICLVPEKRLEITTEGGLDVVNTKKNKLRLLEKIIDYAYKSNIDVSLFIDPDIKQIRSAKSMGVKIVELHTGNFCSSKKEKKIEELEKLKVASEYAHGEGIEVHAGHGINFDTVGDISKIKYITELNIGHFLIGEAIFLGLKKTIIKMRKMIDLAK
tara:strand:+ start:18 stop:758 length:741 start_codon:yes stop_codon:yes gene_type:complete